jgi:hypothetical protein
MKKILVNRNLYILLFSILSVLITGCEKKGPNPVLDYVKNSQLRFSNKVQRDDIKGALYDILTLDKKYLEEQKYRDSSGTDGKWDLKQLMSTYFVPVKPGLTLGNNFYDDVKADSVMVEVAKIYMRY